MAALAALCVLGATLGTLVIPTLGLQLAHILLRDALRRRKLRRTERTRSMARPIVVITTRHTPLAAKGPPNRP